MSYRAIEVTAPGRLRLVMRTASEPNPGEVLLAVEACGICGADRSDIEGGVIGRVLGHEVVGRILAVGAGVPPIWRIGQRVGVGRFGGHCETCPEGLLFDDGAERVSLEHWQGDVSLANLRGTELLVLAGTVTIDGETLGPHSWHRRPAGMSLRATCGADGARVWLKDAALQHANVLPIPVVS